MMPQVLLSPCGLLQQTLNASASSYLQLASFPGYLYAASLQLILINAHDTSHTAMTVEVINGGQQERQRHS